MAGETEAKQIDKGFYPLKHFVHHHERYNYYPWVVDELAHNGRLLNTLTKELSNMGFRKFSYLGAGDNSLVLETTENQLVRICLQGMGENGLRPDHPAILQPIVRQIIHQGIPFDRHTLMIEVMPKVRTQGVEAHHAALLEEGLKKSGYILDDMYEIDAKNPFGKRIRDKAGNPVYRTTNIGLIDVDGKTAPVLIDTGRIRKIKRTAKDNTHLAPWLDADGTWLQKKFDPRIEVTNVINGKELKHVDELLKGPKPFLARLHIKPDARPVSQTVEAMVKDGMYRDEVAQLYKRAYDRLDKDGTNFSELLLEERQKMKEEGSYITKK
jgi:hypothetical protein